MDYEILFWMSMTCVTVGVLGIVAQAATERRKIEEPVPMLIWCPECGERHIDEGEFAERLHHTHACQTCGMVWRPAIEHTVGVQYLPGFKNGE